MASSPETPHKQERRIRDFFSRSERSHFWEKFEAGHLLICFGILVLLSAALMAGSFERFESFFFDTFLKYRVNSPRVSSDLVLIEIDEESLRAVGPWPWPWHYHAQMIQLLFHSGAKAVMFDMLFKEPRAPYEAKAIEEALRDPKPFFLPVMLEPKPEKKIWVHSLPVVLEPEGKSKVWMHSIPSIEAYAQGVGHLNLKADEDGILRRIEPVLKLGDERYDYLPLKVMSWIQKSENREAAEKNKIPLDSGGNFLIPWAGEWQKVFRHYSYESLIRSFHLALQRSESSKELEGLRGKVCLIGLTARDAAPSFRIPGGSASPPLGIHSEVMNGLLTGNWIRPASKTVNLICLILIGVIAVFCFATSRNIPSFVAGLSLGVIWLLFSYLLFCFGGIWLGVFHPLLLIIVLFVVSAIYGQWVSNREQSRLFDLATRDGLTGLYVIRHFRELLNKVVAEAQYRKESLAVILIDIDNFKSINDRYGHPAGDMVLRKTAQAMRQCLRSERPVHQIDIAARYGGEEFIILLRNITLELAVSKVAERIRQAVEKSAFQWKDVFIPVTISLGVALLHADENVPDPMVHRADEALYQAKKTGKNRVCSEPVSN